MSKKTQSIIFKDTKDIDLAQIKILYEDVKWTAYTEDETILQSIIPNSLQVLSAWDKEELVGLVRAVGDGVYILYIQDLLVKESYQGKGIGSELLQRMLKDNKSIRQKVLMTSFEEKTIKFYEKNGLKRADNEQTGIAFVKVGCC